MDEIKFFGFDRQDSVGAKVATHIRLRGACPIKVPFSYVFTGKTITNLNATSFPWPVMVRYILPEATYTPWEMVKNFEELGPYHSRLLEQADLRLLISRPPLVDPEFRHLFFYLAAHYLLAFDTKTQEYLVLNANCEGVFHNEGLNRDEVYRLVRGNPNWYLENIIP